MPIPVTLSAPPDETFANLGGFAPSIEDSVRYAVWLMMYADDVNRRAYSYDDNDAGKGVRIRQDVADYDPETLAMTLPQMGVAVAVASGTWAFNTGQSGEKRITIAVTHFEAPDAEKIDPDVTAPPLTPEARIARMTEILMRGNIFSAAQLDDDDSFELIDPYRSPLNEDGTFDAAQRVTLTTKPPDVRPASRNVFPNRRVKSEQEVWALHPIRDFAVAYGVLATFTIAVPNRNNQRHGGSRNA